MLDIDFLPIISQIFKSVCVLSALAMTIYCCYEFSKNDDFTTLSKRNFNEDETIPYPEFNFMLENFFPVEQELLKMQKNTSHVDYMFSLYRGDNWDNWMLSLDLEKVNSKTMEMVIDTFIKGDRELVFKGLVSTSLYLDGAKILP